MKWFLIGLLAVLARPKTFCQTTLNTDSIQHVLSLKITDEQRLKLSLQLSDFFYKSDPILALEYADESIQLAGKVKSDSLLALCYLDKGNAFLHLGNYSRALQAYQQAVTYSETRADSVTLSIGHGNTGNVYYYQHDYPNAFKYYLKSLKYFSSNTIDKKHLLKKATLLNNIGILYDETKDLKHAETYYEDALILSKKLKDDEMVANVLNNQGTLYRDLGDEKRALQYYLDALAIRIRNNNKLGVARSYHSLGIFYFNRPGDSALSADYLNKAIAEGRNIGSWQTVSSASDYLHQLYKKTNDYKKALAALELHMAVSDSLFNEQSTRKIAQLEMQFEFDHKQAKAAAEQKQRELYFWMGASFLSVLLLGVILLYFFQKNKTRKAELKQAHLQMEKIALKSDLILKDKELAANIMYLINKNELINSISEKLLSIKQTLASDAQHAVQKVILDLQSNLQPELWQEFEFRFQQVHEQFYKTLMERFPDLTPSDRRLCALLKLNMTTKEISTITHQNAKSIDVARTRLRKKLNLTGTDQNLVSFLESMGTTQV